MTLSLVLEGIVAVLLVATIALCVLLNARLRALRVSQAEFGRLAAGLAESTAHAQTAIMGLKVTAQKAGGSLQRRVDKAMRLNEDLAFLTERGDELADRLEGGVRSARKTPAHRSPAAQGPGDKAKADLLEALRAAR